MLSEDHDLTASNSPVTFVTHKQSAILFFRPSCCVNSLLLGIVSEQCCVRFQRSFIDQSYFVKKKSTDNVKIRVIT